MTQSAHESPMGTVIGDRYRIQARLARGGMSTVYRALDLRLDREVALKVLYPHLAEDPQVVERFEREAKTAAKLSHPNVVNVYDQGESPSDNGPIVYLAMEYVPGFTLRTVLNREGPLDTPTALVYLEAMVRGIAAAHERGLIHRDIKPENVLVSPEDGRIKVADFGLARAATQHTGTGATLMGTVAYISPELVAGEKADQRSDVYSIGIVAYELLTAQQPYTAETAVQLALKHLNERVPAPSSLSPDVPEVMDEVVMHCTEKSPEDRPHDAVEVLKMLTSVKEQLNRIGTQTLAMGDVVDRSAEKVLAPDTGSSPDDPHHVETHEELPRYDTPPEPAPQHRPEDATVVAYADEPAQTAAPSPAISGQRYSSQVPVTQVHQLSASAPPAQNPASASRRGSGRMSLRNKANTPTHKLGSPNLTRGMLLTIGVIMLACIALLLGWWLGTVVFRSVFAPAPDVAASVGSAPYAVTVTDWPDPTEV